MTEINLRLFDVEPNTFHIASVTRHDTLDGDPELANAVDEALSPSQNLVPKPEVVDQPETGENKKLIFEYNRASRRTALHVAGEEPTTEETLVHNGTSITRRPDAPLPSSAETPVINLGPNKFGALHFPGTVGATELRTSQESNDRAADNDPRVQAALEWAQSAQDKTAASISRQTAPVTAKRRERLKSFIRRPQNALERAAAALRG